MFDEKREKEILSLLARRKTRKVFIQVPEGLKTGVQNLADFLEKNGISTIISVEPCFGACDLRDRESRALGCDVLLHIGHADMKLKSEIPVVYYEYFIDYDFIPLVKLLMKQIKFRKICLVSTVQFTRSAESAKKFLEKNGFFVRIGMPILGCDVSNAKKFEKMVECYLFIGSGRFHPLGLQEKTEKPVLFLDIEKRTLEDLSKEKPKMEIKRRMRIEKAKYAKSFGIMVSTKPGQLRMKHAEEIKRKLEKSGKKAYILAADQFTPEKLLGLKIDVLIDTACPRLAEDSEQFKNMILDYEEVGELFV